MADGSRWRFPWGLLLSFALIAVVLAGALRLVPTYGAPASWTGVAAEALVAICAFFIMRRLVSWLAGMTAAVFIALSLPFAHAAHNPSLVLPEGLVLASLVCVLIAWRRLEYSPHAAENLGIDAGTLVIAAIAASAVIALAWVVQPRNGLAATLIVASGMILGGSARSRKAAQSSRSWPKIAAAFVFALLAPAAGFFAAVHLHPVLKETAIEPGQFLQQALEIKSSDATALGWTVSPMVLWFVGGLLLWGVWRSVRKGFSAWYARGLPTAWLLPLYAIINLALLPQSDRETGILPVVTCVVLLCVFGIGDFLRSIGQSLILTPPHERSDLQ